MANARVGASAPARRLAALAGSGRVARFADDRALRDDRARRPDAGSQRQLRDGRERMNARVPLTARLVRPHAAKRRPAAVALAAATALALCGLVVSSASGDVSHVGWPHPVTVWFASN